MMKYFVAVLTGCYKDAPRFLSVSADKGDLIEHLNCIFNGKMIEDTMDYIGDEEGERGWFYTEDSTLDCYVVVKKVAIAEGFYEKFNMPHSKDHHLGDLCITILGVDRPGKVFDLSSITVMMN